MSKYIVTGASGFIGNALTKKLLANGDEVWAIVRSKDKINNLDSEKLHIIEADFTQYSQLSDMIAGKDFDCFFHLAWQGTWGAAFQDYTLQLNNAKYACDALLQAAKINCQRFILIGTIVQLEAKKYLLSDEGIPRFSCIYGTAKNAAAMLCRIEAEHLSIGWNLAVLSSVYGIGDTSGMIENTLIKSFLSNQTPKLVEGNNYYDCTYVDDIVNGLIAIANKGIKNKTYYVGHREMRTFREIVDNIRDVLAPDMPLIYGEYPDSTPIDYSLIDINALYNDTGFECHADFKESIMKTANWLKEQMDKETRI